MYKYIEKALTEWPSDMNGISMTPPTTQLFKLIPKVKKQSEEKAKLFHLRW